MKYLVIDTATEQGIAALCDEKGVIGESKLPFGYKHSKHLLPKIDELFSFWNISPKELDFIAVGIGPGSYTGVRVGVVVGKVLAYSLKIPLVGVSSLCAYAPGKEGKFMTLFDARIGGVYMIEGKKSGNKIEWISSAELCSLDHLEKRVEGADSIISPHTETLQKRVEIAIFPAEPQSILFAHEALGNYRRNPSSDPSQTNILYLRKTQAELMKNKS